MTDSAPTTHTLVLKRFFKAPLERVWSVISETSHLDIWFGEAGREGIKDPVFDVRVGGKFEMHVPTDESGIVVIVGEYTAIEPPKRIAFTWKWVDWELFDFDYTDVEFALSEGEGGTWLTLTHSGFPEERPKELHYEGWGWAIDKLEAYLEN